MPIVVDTSSVLIGAASNLDEGNPLSLAFWFKHSEEIKNFGLIAGGIIALTIGLYLAWTRTTAAKRQGNAAEIQAKIATGGHITDRYTAAVEQLGHKSLHVRLGGIYALSHIARDAPSYVETILDVLCAFIRTQKPEGIGPDNEWEVAPKGESEKVEIEVESKARDESIECEKQLQPEWPSAPPDIRAALNVAIELNPAVPRLFELALPRLGEEEIDPSPLSPSPAPRQRDLRDAYLVGVELPKRFLQNFDFACARLGRADLSQAQLQGATLWKAQLQGAYLFQAQLQCADLESAQLQGADLNRAQLQGANLVSARLQGAALGGAQLQGAWLSKAQLQGADLRLTQLQGADLKSAQLQGVDLSVAQLQGADLEHFPIIRSRSLQRRSSFDTLWARRC